MRLSILLATVATGASAGLTPLVIPTTTTTSSTLTTTSTTTTTTSASTTTSTTTTTTSAAPVTTCGLRADYGTTLYTQETETTLASCQQECTTENSLAFVFDSTHGCQCFYPFVSFSGAYQNPGPNGAAVFYSIDCPVTSTTSTTTTTSATTTTSSSPTCSVVEITQGTVCPNTYYHYPYPGDNYYKVDCNAKVGDNYYESGNAIDEASCFSLCDIYSTTGCVAVAYYPSNNVNPNCRVYNSLANAQEEDTSDGWHLAVSVGQSNPCAVTTTTTTTTTTSTTRSTTTSTTKTTTTSSTTMSTTSSSTTSTTSSSKTSTTSMSARSTSSTTSSSARSTKTTSRSTTKLTTLKSTSSTTSSSTNDPWNAWSASSTTSSSSQSWYGWNPTSTSVAWTSTTSAPWSQWTSTTTAAWSQWSQPVVTVITTSYITVGSTGYVTVPYTTTVTVTGTSYVWPTQSNGCPSGFTTTQVMCTGCGASPSAVLVTVPASSTQWNTWTSSATPAASSTGQWNTWVSSASSSGPGSSTAQWSTWTSSAMSPAASSTGQTWSSWASANPSSTGNSPVKTYTGAASKMVGRSIAAIGALIAAAAMLL